MRLKDYKRFVIGAQHLTRKAAALGVCNKTSKIYVANFSITDPEVLDAGLNHYTKLLLEVGQLAVKAGHRDFAKEVTAFIASAKQGGVKRI